MRKCLRILTLAVLAAFCFIVAAHAAESLFELDGFAFSISDAGRATIHGYSGTDTDVVIPNKLLRAPVESIGDYAFYEKTEITSVSFDRAASLTSIGNCAFCGCTGIQKIALPAGVSLSFGSFQKCTALGSLTISEGLGEIPAQCFLDCSALGELSLPGTVTAIGDRAFARCTALKRMDIPVSVTAIAANAFDGCSDLVIYCSKDSYALRYAVAKGIGYVVTDLEPIVVTYVRGDSDNDGLVNIMDATATQRHIALLEVRSFNEEAADSNSDGVVEIMDATRIQRYLAAFDDPYHIGETVTYEMYDLSFLKTQ